MDGKGTGYRLGSDTQKDFIRNKELKTIWQMKVGKR